MKSLLNGCHGNRAYPRLCFFVASVSRSLCGTVISTLALLCGAPDLTANITEGSSYEEVIAEFGNPNGEMQVGGKRVLSYVGGIVKLKDGKVVYIDPRFERNVEREQKHAAFIAKQKAKGLVYYKGQWIRLEDQAPALRREQKLRGDRIAAGTEVIREIRKKGAEIDINSLTVPGRITIIEFFADWCPACRALAPKLRYLAENDDRIFLRRIDIDRWGTPVCKQYDINSTPSVRIFGTDRKMIGEPASNADYIRAAINKGIVAGNR